MLGWWVTTILPLSLVVILAAIGFITWLWFSGPHDPNWTRLVIVGRARTAVSVSAFFVRVTIDVQASISTAMLAAVALESHAVRLSDAPALSFMRACAANVTDVVLPIMAGANWKTSKHSILALTALILSLTSSVLQLSSTALLLDLSIGSIPDFARNTTLPYDFQYMCRFKRKPWTNRTDCAPEDEPSYPFVARASPWRRAPAFYPTFAEYSEPAEQEAGVEDTGLLLRALLPINDQQSREKLRTYSGNALVLDSRVSCHRPLFDNNTRIIQQLGSNGVNISGTVTTEYSTPLLLRPDVLIPFMCYPLAGFAICGLGDRKYSNKSVAADYQFSKPHYKPPLSAGALKSVFSNSTPFVVDGRDGKRFYSWGAAYLIMTTTIHTFGESLPEGVNKPAFAQARNHWLDLTAAPMRPRVSGFPIESRNVSFTLCYTAWDTARLAVDLYGKLNRTEPTVSIKDDAQSLVFASNYSFAAQLRSNYSSILIQLGQDLQRSSAEERGIMQMEKKELWIPSAQDADPSNVRPLVRSGKTIVDFTVQDVVEQGLGANITALLSTNYTGDSKYQNMGAVTDVFPEDRVVADPSLGDLFTEAMANDGSIARTMSSLITVLSNTIYHKQYMQYNTSTTAEQVFFTEALFPRSSRGFFAFIAFLVTHLTTVSFTTVLFLIKTQCTILGDSWRSFAQIVGPQTTELIEVASMKQARDVARQLKRRKGHNPRVGLAKSEGDRIVLQKVEAEPSEAGQTL